MGVNILNTLSAAGDAVLTTEYKDDYIARGQCYGMSKNFVINAAATKTLLLDATGYTGFAVVIYPPKYHSTNGYVEIKLSVDSNYTGTTEITLLNRNGTTSNTATVKVYEDVTGDDVGDVISEDVAGFKNTNQATGGGNNVCFEPFWIDKTKKYLFRIINESGENIVFNMKFVLFEI